MRNKEKEPPPKPPPTEEQLSQFDLETLAEHERIGRMWLSDPPELVVSPFQAARLSLIATSILLVLIWMFSDKGRKKT